MCHSVIDIGGEDAPALDASTMPMNTFEFTASMWRGGPAMIAMQEDEMGGQIEFTGAELANIIAVGFEGYYSFTSPNYVRIPECVRLGLNPDILTANRYGYRRMGIHSLKQTAAETATTPVRS